MWPTRARTSTRASAARESFWRRQVPRAKSRRRAFALTVRDDNQIRVRIQARERADQLARSVFAPRVMA
jgi:hypothetical protein